MQVDLDVLFYREANVLSAGDPDADILVYFKAALHARGCDVSLSIDGRPHLIKAPDDCCCSKWTPMPFDKDAFHAAEVDVCRELRNANDMCLTQATV